MFYYCRTYYKSVRSEIACQKKKKIATGSHVLEVEEPPSPEKTKSAVKFIPSRVQTACSAMPLARERGLFSVVSLVE